MSPVSRHGSRNPDHLSQHHTATDDLDRPNHDGGGVANHVEAGFRTMTLTGLGRCVTNNEIQRQLIFTNRRPHTDSGSNASLPR
jgi:hypothetical protein